MNVLLVAYLPFGVICLIDGPAVLRLFFSTGYSHTAAGAMRWLSMSPVMFALAYIAVVALTALRRTRALLVASLSALVANVVANVVLIPAYSGTGAGAANTIAYGVQAAVVVSVLVAHVGRMSLAELTVEPAIAAAVLAGFLLLMHIPALAEIVAGVAVYAAVWLGVLRWRRPERLRTLLGVLHWDHGDVAA